MNITKENIQDLNQLGYFQNATGDFVCGLIGCASVVKATTDKFMLVTSATNSCSVSVAPSFSALTYKILEFQENSTSHDYFEQLPDGSYRIAASIYIQAKKDKKTSRKDTDTLLRVKSSNVWAYAYDIEQGANIGDLYVQFKNKTGGPGDIYQYLAVPLKVWRKFITSTSKGHYFWKVVRNRFKYRKLTGDKKGKLPNAINSTL